MSGWLVYHPRRIISIKNGITIYHDKTSHNQDPYIWNYRFLHTYCHITQIKQPKRGDFFFWISGDTFPQFNKLFCDLVFVVDAKEYWKNKNSIDFSDEIVDSHEAYTDHYRWVEDHLYKRRRRYTLKACPELSFQPQNEDGNLINIEPILNKYGYDLHRLREGLVAQIGSKPLKLDDSTVCYLYNEIKLKAYIKLSGEDLQKIRLFNSDLASPEIGL